MDGIGALGWVGFLARRVTPSRLIGVAARRAMRRTRNRLAPPLAPPRGELIAGLGCADGAELARLLARPAPRPTPWTPAALRRALDRHLPGEVERAVARAEAAAEGSLVVYGRMVNVARPGGGTDWQLDPIHGGRFSGWAPSAELPPAPGLDPKMAWAMGRGEHWVALACGAVLDERRGDALADALAASVLDFAAENPVGHGVHWTSAMEVALRAWNLLLARWLLSARHAPPDPALATETARLLVASGRFILAHLEDDTAVPNNHLTTDWLGLLACAEALPLWPEAPRWRRLAEDGLRHTAAEQVLEDGTSFEGSVAYHRFSVELFAAGALLAHAAGRGLGAAYASRLAALFRAARGLSARSGELPQLGDNDSGHVLAVRQRGPTEGGHLLPLGAALFRDPELLAGPGPGDAAEVAWLLGPDALSWLARARPRRPPRSASFPHGGFHALRRGPFEVFVSCGPNGQRGIGGHSHNDKLAFELFVDGARGICDPGCPSYTSDPELRNAFRATRAHATVVVDGLEQAPFAPGRLFALPDAAGARLLAFESGLDAERFAGEHHGFSRAGVVHGREIAVLEGGVAVTDRLAGGGVHGVELRWPVVSPGARIRRATPGEAARLARLAAACHARAQLDVGRVVEVPLGAAGALLLAFALPGRLAPQLSPSLRSPGYGELADAAVALAAGRLRLPATFTTLFLHLEAEGSTP